MKTIKVFIYSYKNKNLLSNLLDIIEKESKENIIKYYVYDQNNINNEKKYKTLNNVFYNHIKWDNWSSITNYRRNVLLSPLDYYLELSDKIVLSKNWDSFLINNLKDKSVISGKNKINLKFGNIFIEKKYNNSDSISLTNFINFELFFSKFKDSITLLQLSKLKEVGQDIYGSVLYVNKNINIFSLPNNFYYLKDDYEEAYKPYSIYHGYNDMIDEIKKMNTENFNKFHNLDLSKIKKIPYQHNDVPFLRFSNNLDARSDGRYLNTYNSIEIL
jgi:hypothetical protein